jgi:hypothetical protein
VLATGSVETLSTVAESLGLSLPAAE